MFTTRKIEHAEKKGREGEDVANDRVSRVLKNVTDKNENILGYYSCTHCPFKTIMKRALTHHYSFAHGISKERLEGIKNGKKKIMKEKICINGTKVVADIIDDILDTIIVNEEKLIAGKPSFGKIKGGEKTVDKQLDSSISSGWDSSDSDTDVLDVSASPSSPYRCSYRLSSSCALRGR